MQLPPVDRNLNWRPPGGADLYSTGASGAVPVRPINPVNPVESTDYIGGGVVPRGPDKPSSEPAPNRDWTFVRKQETAEEPPEPPKEPISKQLLEFLQAMWRAGGAAIMEATEEATKAANKPANLVQEPLTYSDPKIKKSAKL
jgi:hypothetical protein